MVSTLSQKAAPAKTAAWRLSSVFVRGFFAAREDQPVLLRSKSNLPAQPDFFGNSPRPP
jgi:hypothetical protein